MIKNNNKSILVNIISIIICLIIIGVFTYVFRTSKTDLKYLYLAIDVFVVYNLYRILKIFNSKDKSVRITKNSNSKVEAKYLRKISL